VHSDRRQTRGEVEPSELAREPVRVEEHADLVAEGEVGRAVPHRASNQPLRALMPSVLTQNVNGLRVQVNPAPASRRLRRADHRLAVHRGQGLHDAELCRVEIEIAPTQPEDLSPTHAGRGDDDERSVDPLTADGGEELT
jgi:hypothetical protein